MGLKDFFAGRRATKQERTIAAMKKRLESPYGQTPERKRAIYVLNDIDTDDAIRALLTRFKVNAEKSIVDEDEKGLVYELLLEKGPRIVPILREYLEQESAIFWPLKILREMVGDEETVTILLDLIDALPTDYVDSRLFERKLSLISQLRDFQDPRIHERLLAWLQDDEEEIRFHAVDAIATYPGHETTNLLVERLLDPDETARIRTFVLDLLIENRWPIKARRKELRAKLPEGFWIDDTGVIQRK